MRCDHDFLGYAEGAGMGASDEADGGFVRHASAVFARELLRPLVERAASAPQDVRAVIAEIRDKLDALDIVVGTFADVRGAAGADGRPRPVSAGSSLANGRGAPPGMDDAREGLDEVGRNQRSRLRELVMLEALAREARPFALQQITAALEARGFTDTSGAIVSQLHRLKKLGIIDQPANGMYAVTDQGLGHMRRLRSSFGGLLAGT